GRAVVAVGWPLMSAGEASPLVEHWSLRLTRDFDRVTPRGPAQRASVQNWPVQADDLARGRHGRLAESTRVIPTTIWILLLVAGGAVIAFTVLFADPSERIVAQLALALSVATAVAASLLTVNFLDV